MTIEICSNLRNNMNPRVTHKQRKSLVTGFKILLSIKLSIILSYYYHSRRRQERAKWALRVSDGDVREVRTDRERETRSGRTVVLGSFPPSLRPVILPSHHGPSPSLPAEPGQGSDRLSLISSVPSLRRVTSFPVTSVRYALRSLRSLSFFACHVIPALRPRGRNRDGTEGGVDGTEVRWR